ncbi:hypothetical protein, partial [uncultured Muribaculum sp.]|uniref:hypothetical protein n=1 Tax=uncultured Muribaculum sp. TaxID=1918613 RepID=UPI00262945E9
RAINLRSFPINYTLFVTSTGKVTHSNRNYPLIFRKLGGDGNHFMSNPVLQISGLGKIML